MRLDVSLVNGLANGLGMKPTGDSVACFCKTFVRRAIRSVCTAAEIESPLPSASREDREKKSAPEEGVIEQ